MAVLSWRSTVTDSTVVATTGAFLSIAPAPGLPRQTVDLPARSTSATPAARRQASGSSARQEAT
jgi:hypothetical protein